MNTLPAAPDTVSLLILMAAMSLLPFLALVVTSYTKIVVVLGLLRNAIGVQQVPPTMVLNGLALVLSCYVMAPVVSPGLTPLLEGGSSQGKGVETAQMLKAADAVAQPLREFLRRHSSERERLFFMRSATALWTPEMAASVKESDFAVLAPAFLLTELTEAFRIGFLIYLAFIVIDLVVANVLLAMGLSQVAPTNVAVPFKLLLFVVLDGWSLLVHGLVMTYKGG